MLALLFAIALTLWSAASADAYVYWGNELGPPSSAVGRANNDGTGVNQNFIGGGNTVCGPTVTADHVYWGNRGGSTIGSANLDGTGANQSFITTGSSLPCGVAVNSANIFWANGGVADSIGRANLDGTSPNNTFITTPDPEGIAIDSAHVYWGSRDSETAIGRANLDGTGVNSTFIDTGSVLTNEAFGVAVDSTHVYWADITAGNIGRANLDGTGVNKTFITGVGKPCGVAVTNSFIYWADANGNRIGRVGLDGTTGRNDNFITGARTPCGVAVDDLPNTTNTTVACVPATVKVLGGTTCTATVTDSASSPTNPTGSVSFGTSETGTFSPAASCTLAVQGTNQGVCSVTYTPSTVGTGSPVITGSYPGDNEHTADDGSTILTVQGRTTSTSLSCTPASVVVSQGTTCTATVDDTDASGTKSAPTGSVDFSSDGSGGFSADPCTLAAVDTDTSSCTSTYTPSQIGDGSHQLTAAYQGGNVHGTSTSSGFDVSVARRATTTGIGCSPSSIVVGQDTTCTATVTDTDANGTPSQPTGDVGFSSLGGSGSFSTGAACTLAGSAPGVSTCTITYTPSSVGSGSHQIMGGYAGSTVHLDTSGSGTVTVGLRPTTTGVSCSPASVVVGQPSSCTATVTDTGPGTASPPSGTAGFTATPSGGSFGSGGTCALVSESASTSSCSVSFTPSASGGSQIAAAYSADADHAASQGAGTLQAHVETHAGTLALTVPPAAIVGPSFTAGCVVSAGELSSCAVDAFAEGTGTAAASPIATGQSSAAGSNLPVTLTLSKAGRRHVAQFLGGLAVSLHASATAGDGSTLDASAGMLLLAPKQAVTPKGAMFGPMSARLTAGGKRFLRGIAGKLSHVGRIRCEGHTASVFPGENRFSKALALDRAQAACAFLRRLGVAGAFKTVTLGKRHPRAPNRTARGRADNRYVSLTITHVP